jgi:MoaA/NifB/PqqE/SkfB family radical SAM enzyme
MEWMVKEDCKYMDLLHQYKNGNYTVKLYDDGTKIRETNADRFISSFPENIDIKISDKCDAGCSFCHENSTYDGDVAHFNYEFLYSLKKGTELAIGGGNIFENEQLSEFLKFCKAQGIVANITVNQNHLTGHFSELNGRKSYMSRYNTYEIFDWIEKGEIYGVGISYNGDAEELERILDSIQYKNNCVIHVINGVHSFTDIMKLSNKGYKLLILGYKDLRRGTAYKLKNKEIIATNQKSIYDNIHEIIKSFEVVSFDNLAIEQLNVRRLCTTDEWNEFYMGDDGQFTMYIDLVKGEFAKNSTSIERFSLLNNIDDMFKVVKSL